MADFSRIIGKKVVAISKSEDSTSVCFETEPDGHVAYRVEGDCCSSSWIEHIEVPDDIEGATVLDVDNDYSVDETDNDAYNPKRRPLWDGDDSREHESLMVYQTRFRTDKGDIVMEYRNSSNGYYGGYLTDA